MHRKLFPGALAFAVLLLCDAGAAGAVTPRLVKDINPVASNPGSALRFLTVLNNGIGFFLADDGIAGYELWRSDGTQAGTWRLLDTCDSCSSHTASAKVFANAGDRLFFLALNEEREHEMDLWVTGGSEGDTFLLSDELSIPDQDPLWMASRRLLFFSADDGEHGLQLWRSDGTAAGTWRVTDQDRRQRNFGIFDLVELNGRVFFPVDDGVNGPALWASDGTPAGTRMVRDPWRGRQDHVGPFYLGVVGQRLLFFAEGPNFGLELWASDGTTRGTVPITNLVPGAGKPTIYRFVLIGNRFWFIADTGRGQQLWVSDGTRRGTRALTDSPSVAVAHSEFILVGGKVAFYAADGVHGVEPWISDGTRAGTRMLRDVCPGVCGSRPQIYSSAKGRLFFTADDGVRGIELWTSDGTAAGTRLVRDLCPGACSSHPGWVFDVGGRLLFSAAGPVPGAGSLWRTDGTARGTVRLASFEREFNAFHALILPGVLLFQGHDPEHGAELWRSDGTRPGTRLLKDVNSADIGGSNPRQITRNGNRIAFVASAPDATDELWALE